MAEENKSKFVEYGLDSLTGINTFDAFTEKMWDMLHKHQDKSYVLIVWDIEHFKMVNDLLGMETADKILMEFGKKLDTQIQGYGICGRLGGDIFACSFERKYLDLDEFERKMEADFETLQIDYKVISQAGIYYIDDIDVPVYQMCDRAKLALKTVKGKHDKRFAIYDNSMRKEIIEEQEIIMDMERGLEERQFFVEIQPIYELNNDRIVSAEALVRWKHPQKGIISPGKFIPVFERNGMITKLDIYVWEEVCKLLQRMKLQGNKTVPVSVNVSRLNLFRESLCDEIIDLLHKYELDTSMLRLEITESAYVDSPKQLNDAIKKLQKSGFKILMDDFGTGYSSLNMLKDLSFDILKVDMRFIDDLDSSPRAMNVVTTIVRMAKWLGMTVVAEGVEKRSQAVFLKSIGCDRVQGFFFSRPLSEERFKSLIEENPHHDNPIEKLDNLDLDGILNSTDLEMRSFLKEMVGALALYEVEEEHLKLIKVNDSYYQLFDTTPQKIFEEKQENTIHSEDRKRILECCSRAYKNHSIEHTRICRQAEGSAAMWLHLRVKYVGDNRGKQTFYISFSDITQYHEMEKELKRKHYSEILCNVYQEILEMNYTSQKITTIFRDGKRVKSSMDENNLQTIIQFFAETRVCESDRVRFLEIFSEVKMEEFYQSKENSIVFEIQVKDLEKNIKPTEVTIFKVEKETGQRVFLICNRRKNL